jgi:hypothetical protein
MTTFHPFPRLPLELREQIWKDAVEPRTVDVRRILAWPHCQLVSSTPIPAILQSCREARNLARGPYKQYFFEAHATTKWRGTYAPEIAIERFFSPDEPEEEGPVSELRYVWLNLDIDTVDIGASSFRDYEPIASAVKRLRCKRENGEREYWRYGRRGCTTFIEFPNVEEIQVVCADRFWNWPKGMQRYAWPCAYEKILFTDPHGRVARGLELKAVYKQLSKAALLENMSEVSSTGGA